jgi:opacity protein-like surface antigen
MKRTFTTLAILAAAVTSAAATDLPSKKIPTPPTPVFTQTNYYVGVNVGAETATKQMYSGGITAGVNVLPYLAVEAAYDFGYSRNSVKGKHEMSNEVSLNVIPQYKIYSDVTVYALAGTGLKYSDVSKNIAFYNVGGGLKYEFAKNLELDGRYRYSDAIANKYNGVDQTYTLGLNYKF